MFQLSPELHFHSILSGALCRVMEKEGLRHMCHLLGLILMAKDWQVLVAAGVMRDEEIEEEDDGDEGEEDEEIFDVKEINPPSYVDI
jgi:hypothetical protein